LVSEHRFVLSSAIVRTVTTATRVLHVFAVQVTGCPSLQGAGLLLAESVVGARNALHSKAPRLLAMLLAEDVVKTSELKTNKARSPMRIPRRYPRRHTASQMSLPVTSPDRPRLSYASVVTVHPHFPRSITV
jgi:hypothetical protein